MKAYHKNMINILFYELKVEITLQKGNYFTVFYDLLKTH